MLLQSGVQDCWEPGLLSRDLYFALFDANGDELSGDGYARVQHEMANWVKSTTAPTASNTTRITWPTATADWDPISTVRLMTALTGGDGKVEAQFNEPVVIGRNSAARININQFVLRFAIVSS